MIDRRIPLPLTAAVAALALLFSGCSLGVESAGQMPAANGCGNAAPSGFFDGSMTHGGRQRTFNVYIPKGYDGETQRALVVAMHGGLGTGAIIEEQAKLAPAADRHGYLVVYPDGIARAFNAGTCCGEPMKKNIDDVGFIADLIDKMASQYCVDKNRVYGTGFSNGAMLTHRIACERPDLFAAIAPVSGNIMVDSCPAGRAIPALLIQGKADDRIPWKGGTVRGTYRKPMTEVVSMIAKRNHCETGEQTTFEGGAAVCRTRQGCADKAPVTYCGIEGVGHQWPGGKTYMRLMLGANTDQFDATAHIFDFFEKVGTGP